MRWERGPAARGGVCWQEGVGSTGHPPTAHRQGERGPGVCTESWGCMRCNQGNAQSIREVSAEASRMSEAKGDGHIPSTRSGESGMPMVQ